MENLWPTNLLVNTPGLRPNEIENVLEMQAFGLSTVTGGLVVGRVRNRSFLPARAWSLHIEPVDQPGKAYEFLIIRSADGGYPVVVEAYHLQDMRSKRCDSQTALQKVLRKIFAEPKSTSIIRNIADEAMAAGAVPDPVASKREPTARPIEIGTLFNTSDGAASSISMFGISGHVSEKTLMNLRDRNPRTIEPLNERFVVTIPFIGTVKTTVSKEELDIIVAQSIQSLKRD